MPPLRTNTALQSRVKRLRSGRAYRIYEEVRDWVLALPPGTDPTDEPSTYWKQELAGSLHLFDASPLIVQTLRHHCHHVTGVYESCYRDHHDGAKDAHARQLEILQALDAEG